jgi:hypothetical protein
LGQPARKDYLDMATAVQSFSPHSLAETVGVLPHVLKIFVAAQGRTVDVWTVVDSFDRDVRDQIYSAERTLFSYFPDYKFDFNVIEGDETATIPGAKLVYSAR